MIVLNVAKTASEWHDAVMERDRYECLAEQHAPNCRRRAEQAHHIVYKSAITEKSHWIVQNGIALSKACHDFAHETKNRNLGLQRCNEAVDAVNCVENIKVKKFTKKGGPL